LGREGDEACGRIGAVATRRPSIRLFALGAAGHRRNLKGQYDVQVAVTYIEQTLNHSTHRPRGFTRPVATPA
jgi:hypothetical protein